MVLVFFFLLIPLSLFLSLSCLGGRGMPMRGGRGRGMRGGRGRGRGGRGRGRGGKPQNLDDELDKYFMKVLSFTFCL